MITARLFLITWGYCVMKKGLPDLQFNLLVSKWHKSTVVFVLFYSDYSVISICPRDRKLDPVLLCLYFLVLVFAIEYPFSVNIYFYSLETLCMQIMVQWYSTGLMHSLPGIPVGEPCS